jgi:hypothetical protein
MDIKIILKYDEVCKRIPRYMLDIPSIKEAMEKGGEVSRRFKDKNLRDDDRGILEDAINSIMEELLLVTMASGQEQSPYGPVQFLYDILKSPVRSVEGCGQELETLRSRLGEDITDTVPTGTVPGKFFCRVRVLSSLGISNRDWWKNEENEIIQQEEGDGWCFVYPARYPDKFRHPESDLTTAPQHRISVSIPPIGGDLSEDPPRYSIFEIMSSISVKFPGIFYYKIPSLSGSSGQWTRQDTMTIYINSDDLDLIIRLQEEVRDAFGLVEHDEVIRNLEPSLEEIRETTDRIEKALSDANTLLDSFQEGRSILDKLIELDKQRYELWKQTVLIEEQFKQAKEVWLDEFFDEIQEKLQNWWNDLTEETFEEWRNELWNEILESESQRDLTQEDFDELSQKFEELLPKKAEEKTEEKTVDLFNEERGGQFLVQLGELQDQLSESLRKRQEVEEKCRKIGLVPSLPKRVFLLMKLLGDYKKSTKDNTSSVGCEDATNIALQFAQGLGTGISGPSLEELIRRREAEKELRRLEMMEKWEQRRLRGVSPTSPSQVSARERVLESREALIQAQEAEFHELTTLIEGQQRRQRERGSEAVPSQPITQANPPATGQQTSGQSGQVDQSPTPQSVPPIVPEEEQIEQRLRERLVSLKIRVKLLKDIITQKVASNTAERGQSGGTQDQQSTLPTISGIVDEQLLVQQRKLTELEENLDRLEIHHQPCVSLGQM